MDEVILLMAEAQSIADDMQADVDRARRADSDDDAKESIQRVLQLSEEMRDRLEEALDFAESEEDEESIEDSLDQLEDVMDSGHLALTSDDRPIHLEDLNVKLTQIVARLGTMTGVEQEIE